jgi:hypothetical protein
VLHTLNATDVLTQISLSMQLIVLAGRNFISACVGVCVTCATCHISPIPMCPLVVTYSPNFLVEPCTIFTNEILFLISFRFCAQKVGDSCIEFWRWYWVLKTSFVSTGKFIV